MQSPPLPHPSNWENIFSGALGFVFLKLYSIVNKQHVFSKPSYYKYKSLITIWQRKRTLIIGRPAMIACFVVRIKVTTNHRSEGVIAFHHIKQKATVSSFLFYKLHVITLESCSNKRCTNHTPNLYNNTLPIINYILCIYIYKYMYS